MKRTPVKSSNIKEVGYDHDEKILQLRFKSGGVHNYSPVGMELYLRFLRSPSKGKFFCSNIKNNKLIKSEKE
ncbi:KTSC domain-containing protein [Candidatus Wolfebacteria bacterium]|nr:MAG: KTSC domain-containing protein [Candidatus Wolfebacteria bacterium]